MPRTSRCCPDLARDDLQSNAVHLLSAAVDCRNHDRAVHGFFERGHADDPCRQLDVPVDPHTSTRNAPPRRIAVLAVEGTVARPEPEIRTGWRRHAHVATPQHRNRRVLARLERGVVDLESARIHSIEQQRMLRWARVGVQRTFGPVKVDFAPRTAGIHPSSQRRALLR